MTALLITPLAMVLAIAGTADLHPQALARSSSGSAVSEQPELVSRGRYRYSPQPNSGGTGRREILSHNTADRIIG